MTKLAIISPSKYAGEAGDEGSYAYEHIVAEDIVWGPSAGAFSYEERPLRERADAFLVHFAVAGDPLDGYLAALARGLEESGFPVLNSAEFTLLCGDKVFALNRAERLGIPVPRTLLAHPAAARLGPLTARIERDFSYPLVIKPRGTMRAYGVVKVTDRSLLVSTLQLYAAAGLPCLIQDFVRTGGREVRCLYAGAGLVGVYDRHKDPDAITAPMAAARVEPARGLTSDCERLLEGFIWDVAAIDWFVTEQGYVLNEINTVPGVQTLPDADQAAFHRRIGEAIRRRRAG